MSQHSGTATLTTHPPRCVFASAAHTQRKYLLRPTNGLVHRTASHAKPAGLDGRLRHPFGLLGALSRGGAGPAGSLLGAVAGTVHEDVVAGVEEPVQELLAEGLVLK